MAVREAERSGVHLGDLEALGLVAGGGGRRRVGGIVHAEDGAVGAQEAGGLEALAAAHIEDAARPDALEDGPVPRLMQGEQGVRGHPLLRTLPREPALGAGGHGAAPFACGVHDGPWWPGLLTLPGDFLAPR